jgi:hypothetical protein
MSNSFSINNSLNLVESAIIIIVQKIRGSNNANVSQGFLALYHISKANLIKN